MKEITMNSRIKDVYAHPIGHDIIAKVLLQMGIRKALIENPAVGNLKLKTVKKLAGKVLDDAFYDVLLRLLNQEKDIPATGTGPITHAWWKEAVFYQIYPRTFCDSNGDGIGDLQGIISKLDYLKELGVDALWLSPIYDSPNDDNGYDIRDYEKIQEEFGTMEDFDRLLEEVHKREMKLIMDLVVNHTSDEHRWFQEALKDPSSPYRKYYFFRESETVPNNWTSFFSGSAWNRYGEDTWALHLFSKKQMDLNWENPDLREEIIGMINRWLDKGVDGFRMDVINYISKAEGLPQGNVSVGQLMGYTGIENYYYGPHLHEYLREIREKAFAPHQAFSVGETPGLGMRMSQLISGEDRGELDCVFSFDHLENPGHVRFEDYRYDLNAYRDYIIDFMQNYGSQCRTTLYWNNHDNPRMISKVTEDPAMYHSVGVLLAVLQMTLMGVPFVYQGDEMGLVNVPFRDMNDITDVESKGKYQELLETMTPEEAWKIILAGTREHTRVPLPWNAVPEGQEYRRQTVDAEMTEVYRKLIALRREHPALVYGNFRVINRYKDHFCYEREDNSECIRIETNLSDHETAAQSHKGYLLLYPGKYESEKRLAPYEARIWIRKK